MGTMSATNRVTRLLFSDRARSEIDASEFADGGRCFRWRSDTHFLLAFVLFFLCAATAAVADDVKEKGGPPWVVQIGPEDMLRVTKAIDAGRLDEALTLARQIENPFHRVLSLGEVSQALAASGKVDRVKTLALSMDRVYQRDWMLRNAVVGLASRNEDSSAALELAELIDDPSDKTEALSHIAFGQFARGQIDDAKHTVQRASIEASSILNSFDSAAAAGRIAAMRIALGQPSELEKIFGDLFFWFGPTGLLQLISSASYEQMHKLMKDVNASPGSGEPR